MRSLAFIIALVAAYLLLRGHPERMPVLLRTCVAVLVLVAGLGFWGHRVRPREGNAASRRVPGWLDYAAIGSVTNLAARLCAEARAGEVLVSDEVWADLPGRGFTAEPDELLL